MPGAAVLLLAIMLVGLVPALGPLGAPLGAVLSGERSLPGPRAMVGPVPSVSVVASATPDPGDAGAAIFFAAWASGCTLACSFAWTFADGSGPATGQWVNHTFARTGVFGATCWANGTVGQASRSFPVTVNPAVGLAASVSADPTDVGQNVTFRSAPTAGTPPYRFAWRLGDGANASTQNTTHLFAAPGLYPVRAWANDSGAGGASALLNVTVHPRPVLTVSAAPTWADVGQPVAFGVTIAGGTGPYAETWRFADGAFMGGANVSHAFGAVGNYTAKVWVNDSAGASVAGPVNISVFQALLAVPHVDHPYADAQETLHFSGDAYAGAPPYRFAWRGVGGFSASTQNATFAFPAPGTFAVTLWANDSSGGSNRSSLTVQVGPALQLTVQATPSLTDLGSPVLFSSSVTGGAPPVTYAWSFGDGGSSAAPDPQHAFNTSGTFVARLTVGDAVGSSRSSTINVTVAPALQVRASGTVPATDPGRPVNFTATPQGGSAPYSYVWLFGDGGSSTASTQGGATHTFARPGSYTIRVYANDSGGGTATGTVALVVNAALQAAPAASQTTAPTDRAVNFSGLFVGGTGPFTFAWSLGDGARSSARNFSHAFSAPGTYPIAFWVNDSVGGSAEGNLSVTVNAVAGPATMAPFPWTWALLLGGLALIVAALVLLEVRRWRASRGAGGTGALEEGAISSGSGPEEPFDYAGTPEDMPPWPTGPFTAIEGPDPEVLLRLLQAGPSPMKDVLLFVAEDPETLRERFGLEDAAVFRISRLEGEVHIPPADLDRISQLSEVHLARGPGRVVAILPITAMLSASGLRSMHRLLQVLYETASERKASILIHLDPRRFTIPERRSLEENAQRVRVGRKERTD